MNNYYSNKFYIKLWLQILHIKGTNFSNWSVFTIFITFQYKLKVMQQTHNKTENPTEVTKINNLHTIITKYLNITT